MEWTLFQMPKVGNNDVHVNNDSSVVCLAMKQCNNSPDHSHSTSSLQPVA